MGRRFRVFPDLFGLGIYTVAILQKEICEVVTQCTDFLCRHKDKNAFYKYVTGNI